MILLFSHISLYEEGSLGAYMQDFGGLTMGASAVVILMFCSCALQCRTTITMRVMVYHVMHPSLQADHSIVAGSHVQVLKLVMCAL